MYKANIQIKYSQVLKTIVKELEHSKLNPQNLEIELTESYIMEDVEEQVVLNLFTFNGEETFWDDKFKEYLKFFHDKVTTQHKNPLYLTLWSDDIQVLDNQISMDADGNILTSLRSDLRLGTPDKIAISLRDLDEDSDYIVKITAVKEPSGETGEETSEL